VLDPKTIPQQKNPSKQPGKKQRTRREKKRLCELIIILAICRSRQRSGNERVSKHKIGKGYREKGVGLALSGPELGRAGNDYRDPRRK